ncbi:MAG: 3-dehydroquinate synthase [Gammaproteobacteria bacterium]|nr:3-dehydroquinate synthase [Gammaproteobacteria bacterium]NKB64109.1 3-dehydroquinate synthase [Gammaproteobacteria bacterium]
MKTVNIDLGNRSYQIRIADGLLKQSEELAPWVSGKQVVIVTNDRIAPLFLDQVKQSLKGKQVFEIILSDGEHTKTLQTAEGIFDKLLAIPCDRKVTLIALGGGVIGDMVGFAAACYQRGVAFIQIPTTLLSQVDSSVGGKTAVNHPRGKNMIGAFYQPVRVIADTSSLQTLDDRQFASGVAEVIKYGLINDPEFFQWLEQDIELVIKKQPEALAYIIERSCINKARIVEQDEHESGIRALLNLGHTFGHAIEAGFGYGKWLHGEAVAIGMVMAAQMSRQLGWLSEASLARTKSLIKRASLPVEPFAGLTKEKMLELMKLDKKVEDGNLKLILLEDIGKAVVSSDYKEEVLDSVIDQFIVR